MSKLTEGLTYQYLSAEDAPTREVRLGVCSAFGGSCERLKDGLSNGCSKFNSRKFAQGSGCQLGLALGIVSSFRNTVIIIHGPLGCGSGRLGRAPVRRSSNPGSPPPSGENIWIHTNLDENDVISGGIEKLRQAVLYAEKEYRPEAIVVGNACVPGIIGDNIDALLEELGGRISAKLVPVHCEGFKSRFVASGYDAAYHGMLKKLVEPVKRINRSITDDLEDAREKYVGRKTVNLLNVGSTSIGDELELARLIQALDLKVNVLPLRASLDEIARFSEAALNVSICATHDDYLVGHLKERFGTEYIIDTLPIGIKNTSKWIREIAKFFRLEEEAEKLIEYETAQLEEALEPFRKVLKGKSVFVGGGETRVLTTGELYQSLGMKVVGVKPHCFDRFAIPMLENIDNPDLFIEVAPGQPAEELNLLKKLKPDLYVGHTSANGWVKKLGIPTTPLFGQSFNFMGYSGAYELARKAVRALKNTSFTRRISANLPLPFRSGWYETDIADNIKEAVV